MLLFTMHISRACHVYKTTFLPRCMECRRGLTMRHDENSVCLSVCPSVRPAHA